MTPKLTPELSAALRASGNQPMSVIDPSTNHVYVVVDQAEHEQTMQTLRAYETANAIREGLADVDAGRSMPLEVARELTTQRLHANYSTSKSE